jgi:hypothetical protein
MAPGKPVTWRRSPDTAWKNSTSLLRRYRNAVAGAGPGPADAHWGALADSVWTQRFATVAKDLAGARRVLVVAAEPMGGIPLAPLGPRGGKSLLDRCEILAATSAVDFTRVGASPTRLHLRPTLVVADPPYGGKPMVVAATRSGDEANAGEAMPDGAVLRSALGHNRSALGSLPRLTASPPDDRLEMSLRPSHTVSRTDMLSTCRAGNAGLFQESSMAVAPFGVPASRPQAGPPLAEAGIPAAWDRLL